MPSNHPSRVVSAPQTERPRLELSGLKLSRAFASLVAGSEETGGVERYVEAAKLKSTVFQEALAAGRARAVDLVTLRQVCAYAATARRRVGPYVQPQSFERLRERIVALLDGAERTAGADHRLATFCRSFPEDRDHRWVRDFAAEILHNVDPERYPLMSRWVWDARTNTGVVREIWHGEDVDRLMIGVPDGYETFVVLREELAQFLASNGVFRDVMFYVDLLTARVYANYIDEQGGTYLRTDFATPEEPMLHTRRILGLDGVAPDGRTRLKAADGTAFVVNEAKRLH